jgi:CRP-like cAMP-binding protein
MTSESSLAANARVGPVLIVEDDYFIAQELRQALRGAGAEVLGPASDAATALELARSNPVGLAVLDIGLHGGVVFPLAERLSDRQVPIVFASGYDRTQIPERFASVPLFIKPFDARTLAVSLAGGRITALPEEVFANRLLRNLPAGVLSELRPHMSLAPFSQGETLVAAGTAAPHVMFVERGLCAFRAPTPAGHVAVSFVGNEGLIGVSTLLEAADAGLTCKAVVAGCAVRVSAEALRMAVDEHPDARAMLLRYAHVLMLQTSANAAGASALSIEARVARLLLMCADRVGAETPLTHEAIAAMLAVRRAGVTEALQRLAAHGCIERRRGRIEVRNRFALEALAGEAYGLAERAYEQLVAPGCARN